MIIYIKLYNIICIYIYIYKEFLLICFFESTGAQDCQIRIKEPWLMDFLGVANGTSFASNMVAHSSYRRLTSVSTSSRTDLPNDQ